MSLLRKIRSNLIDLASERACMTPQSKKEEAYVVARLFQKGYVAMMADLERLGQMVQEDRSPVEYSLQILRRALFPRHSSLMETRDQLKNDLMVEFAQKTFDEEYKEKMVQEQERLLNELSRLVKEKNVMLRKLEEAKKAQEAIKPQEAVKTYFREESLNAKP